VQGVSAPLINSNFDPPLSPTLPHGHEDARLLQESASTCGIRSPPESGVSFAITSRRSPRWRQRLWATRLKVQPSPRMRRRIATCVLMRAASSSSAPPRITKPKRQRIKHDGKPPLQFIVSTSDLSQFKDEDVKRNVRSQAMLVWRQKDREKRAPKGKGNATPVEPPDEPSVEPSGSESPANVDNVKPIDDFEPMDDIKPAPDDTKPGMERLSLSTSEGSSASSSHMLDEPPQGQQIPHSPTYLAWWGSVPLSDYEEYGEEQDAYGGTSSQALVLRKTVDYEESEKHETHTYKGLIHQLAAFYQVGNGADPFDALPQFENPELNSLYLTRNSEYFQAVSNRLVSKTQIPCVHLPTSDMHRRPRIHD
jgi:hypothetical protein